VPCLQVAVGEARSCVLGCGAPAACQAGRCLYIVQQSGAAQAVAAGCRHGCTGGSSCICCRGCSGPRLWPAGSTSVVADNSSTQCCGCCGAVCQTTPRATHCSGRSWGTCAQVQPYSVAVWLPPVGWPASCCCLIAAGPDCGGCSCWHMPLRGSCRLAALGALCNMRCSDNISALVAQAMFIVCQSLVHSPSSPLSSPVPA
jgi:hypothetical protein